MKKQIQSAFDSEKQQLEHIAAEIMSQIKRLEKIPRYFGDDITEQALDDRREQARKNLQIAKEEPYFGRLDFNVVGKADPDELYIGKVGVTEESTNDLMVIDWRAPVASLFYSYSGGEDDISYSSPEGTIEGDIHLKRNVVIRNQKLQRVVDTYVKGGTDTGSTDEFLLYRLGDKKDNKLRDIVSTIQSEQNHIIRAEKNQPLIIQGVAGSGKTTVALHRLAYLLYHYRDHLSANQMVIFAPNHMFLDYISNVLPELGVGGIQQTTFTEWAQDILGEALTVRDEKDYMKHFFSPGSEASSYNGIAGKLKGASTFKNRINEAFHQFQKEMVPDTDFVLWKGSSLSASIIKKWVSEQAHFPISVRRKKVVRRLKAWIQERVALRLPHERKDLKKSADKQVKTFMKAWPDYNAFTFYKELFKKTNIPDYSTPIRDYLSEEIIRETRNYLNKKVVMTEDLPALVWIHQKLFGKDKNFMYQHVVIDEAQDFSPFHIEVLRSNARQDSFTILGDISQGIYSYKGIESWQELTDVFGDRQSKYVQLERSYRSTLEIIEYANRILQNMKRTSIVAKPVFRSGEPVKEIQMNSVGCGEKVLSILRQLQESEANSIAIIGRTIESCEEVYEKLVDEGFRINLITGDQADYTGGISVIPVYLTKGLEFDAVILFDADAKNYRHNDDDAKLLYVGCTRALHQLWILYEGTKTPLVQTKYNL